MLADHDAIGATEQQRVECRDAVQAAVAPDQSLELRYDGAAARHGREALRFVAWTAEVEEAGGHLAPVAELEGALAEAAAGDDGDGIGGAAIDLDEGDEALAVGAVHQAAGVVDAQHAAAQHGHADSKYLPGAEMAVGDLSFAQQAVERLHGAIIAPCDAITALAEEIRD